MATPLDQEQIQLALADLPGWELDGDRLRKSFSFGSFKEAMSFLVRVGFEADGRRLAGRRLGR